MPVAAMLRALALSLAAGVACGGSDAAQEAPSVSSGIFVLLSIQGSGTVTSSPPGLQCTGPLSCSPTAIATQPGSVVNLLATPAAGAKFLGWSVTTGASAHYEELVDASGQPTTGSYDAKCAADYPTSTVQGANLSSPNLSLPAGAVPISASSVSCQTPGQAPAPARSIDVPIAYLLTATFAAQ